MQGQLFSSPARKHTCVIIKQEIVHYWNVPHPINHNFRKLVRINLYWIKIYTPNLPIVFHPVLQRTPTCHLGVRGYHAISPWTVQLCINLIPAGRIKYKDIYSLSGSNLSLRWQERNIDNFKCFNKSSLITKALASCVRNNIFSFSTCLKCQPSPPPTHRRRGRESEQSPW